MITLAPFQPAFMKPLTIAIPATIFSDCSSDDKVNNSLV
jgi:hypothetical protein